VIRYVENIRDGLSKADPAGAATYQANAGAYLVKLKELDRWIADRAQEVPEANRLLVTNHESFGYFADRYGFKIIGTLLPSVSTGSSPSAQQLAQLIDHITATGAKAIFLETGTNPQLAEQVAKETGSQVITNLYSHSITEASGPAPTYIDMMKFNTNAIVDALK
jgi:ABC-type Zn uptake system ZnuABC Zn-binding protein ZnuA